MTSTTPYKRIAASLVLAFVATVSLAVPAQAAESAAPLSCWSDADTGEQQCFEDDATRDAAIEDQTGTELKSGAETNKAAKSTTNARAAVAATYVLATFYWSANYTGSTWVITSGYASLCSTYSYKDDIVGGWNDQIGSFKSYGTCKTKLSENANWTGSSYGPVKLGPTLGYLGDKASSYFITG
ncbi:hypothetical protein EYE40_04515 [Glaciihabitans arcticus]|uniref:Peptidase inhibitor family I36 protein n=1 Tax=Glaciihabitans arcticus TaxID=2668039 RepID=A0A4Q9GPS5_9MICO|nr:hypothetical protein [Glaciihabitans arcticus]TBN56721.1 hypothetical protein EYE40_04515 [Glaciihabitans arcticus]